MQSNLFSFQNSLKNSAPLADRMRPQTVDEIVGQTKLLGPNGALKRLMQRQRLPSLILWGPPGVGKTTLAQTLSTHIHAEFVQISAVMAGVKDIRRIVSEAQQRRGYHHQATTVFIDEIHRFNKSQQDALLPHVENGLFTLIGATTENPSFEVNAPLLSRCRVLALEPLSNADITQLLERALKDEKRGFGKADIQYNIEILKEIAKTSGGDARYALGTLEVCAELALESKKKEITRDLLEQSSQRKLLRYDKTGDEHYGIVSAFIKSLRGSDPDASIYWLTRMLEAGESPRFILRRMIIFASEDIGNADIQALQVATNALKAFEMVGLPEGALAITQAVAYLATAPKSNATLLAYTAARKEILHSGPLPVPQKLKNKLPAPGTQDHFAVGYRYPHNFENHYVHETYLPDAIVGRKFYEPSDQGHELAMKERLKILRSLEEKPKQ